MQRAGRAGGAEEGPVIGVSPREATQGHPGTCSQAGEGINTRVRKAEGEAWGSQSQLSGGGGR